jgi:hypothetical protein
VTRHNGAIIKTIGDAVMATFLEPADAVAAALSMRNEIDTFNGRQPDRALILKIGIHKGAAIAVTSNGSIISARRSTLRRACSSSRMRKRFLFRRMSIRLKACTRCLLPGKSCRASSSQRAFSRTYACSVSPRTRRLCEPSPIWPASTAAPGPMLLDLKGRRTVRCRRSVAVWSQPSRTLAAIFGTKSATGGAVLF